MPRELIYKDEAYSAVLHDNPQFAYCINRIKPVDAVEVVHARWKYYHKKNIAVCTNCSFERNLDADFGKAVSCPNCGALMDGGNEDVLL